jgi:hypothetical protein
MTESEELQCNLEADKNRHSTEEYELLRCPALNDILNGVEEGHRNGVAFRLSQYFSRMVLPGVVGGPLP